MTKSWSILKNGNFTKLLILILLSYALGKEAILNLAQNSQP